MSDFNFENWQYAIVIGLVAAAAILYFYMGQVASTMSSDQLKNAQNMQYYGMGALILAVVAAAYFYYSMPQESIKAANMCGLGY